jgi:hypothetical protein
LELGLPLAPAHVGAGYLAWPLLPDLFPVSFPGVKTSRDELVVDIDRDRLVARMKMYFDPRVSHEEMRRTCPAAMTSTARFNAEVVRDYLRKRGFLTQNIVPYCYRPFDTRWLYWEPDAGLLDRNRADYVPQVFEENWWVEARQKQPMEDFDRGYVTRALADNFGNGLSNFFPLLLRREQRQPSLGEHVSDSPETNVSSHTVHYIQAVSARAPDLFFHTIAVLHAPSYRRENASALRQDWPRIPLPDSKELLLASAALGRRVAELLNPETPFDVAPASRRQSTETRVIEQRPPEWWRYIGVPSRVDGKPLDETKDLAVTAGWGHAGKEGVTMPGKGRVVERDYTLEEREDLLGDQTCDVYLNDVAYWRNIPIRVWQYTIGGYQVIKKWLSYREEKLLGRPMIKDEVRWVQEMARRIAAILLLEPELDENYQTVKRHLYQWPEGAVRVPPSPRLAH